MPSSNTMRVLSAAAGVFMLGAALLTAVFASDDNIDMRHGTTTVNEVPLAYGSGILDKGQRSSNDFRLASVVQRNAFDLTQRFSADGLMGDGKAKGEYLDFDDAYSANAHSGGTCLRFSYRPGPTGWAGQYWLNAPSNFGEASGSDLSGLSRIVFWARGETGRERVEFKAGGIDGTRRPDISHKDSFSVSLGTLQLSTKWRQYTIDLRGADLSSVIGGFAWVATKAANPEGLVFYLDDIRYEGGSR